jgi:hypothetical protein
MTTKELLESCPKATDASGEYFYGKLVNSLVNADVTEEYKDFVKSQEFSNEFIANVMDTNPRAFFDVFDNNGIIINIAYTPDGFTWGLYMESDEIGIKDTTVYNFRVEAERVAVENVFKLLNDKL